MLKIEQKGGAVMSFSKDSKAPNKVRVTSSLDHSRVLALEKEAQKKGLSVPMFCATLLSEIADEFKNKTMA